MGVMILHIGKSIVHLRPHLPTGTGGLARERSGVALRTVSPDNVQETGVSPRWTVCIAQRGRRGAADRANSKKDLVTARSEVFVPYTCRSGLDSLLNRSCA